MKIPLKNEIRKPTKTISGITPVAVMLPPRKCNHGACIYCPNLNVPQSYTPKSPVVMRASRLNYDAYKQVRSRLRAFQAMHHPTDKIEIIIMGGTFLQYPEKFQNKFIKELYEALNNRKSKNLEEAKKVNEKSRHRCVALCIETRPDECSNKDIKRMRKWGATRVELGVQIIDDKIYKKINRGHTVKDVVNATKRLRNSGFKIGYHIMPGLPGSNLKKDFKLFKKLFSDKKFKPDQLKIYPCQVMPGSALEEIYWKGEYKPYTKEQLKELITHLLKEVPRYCRVMRVMREIPPEYIIAGTKRIDMRNIVEEELKKNKIRLKEIRYREIGFVIKDKDEINLNLQLKITKYKASDGDEYFLEIINKDDILFGLCRLRIFDFKNSVNKKELLKRNVSVKLQLTTRSGKGGRGAGGGMNKHAIIRELHVYGPALRLGEKSKASSQHKGLGRWLLNEAENITRKKKIKKISIISGVGVREYYKNLGYKLEKETELMIRFL
jgi:elongator complex protein 3